MKLAQDKARRRLGAPTFALWLFLLTEVDQQGWVNLTRARMASQAGLTPKQVRRALEKLGKALLVSRAMSRRDPHRKVWGSTLDGNLVDVPSVALEYMQTAPKWGGRRRGAGRPKSKNEPKLPIQTGQIAEQKICDHCRKSMAGTLREQPNQEGHETDQKIEEHTGIIRPPRIPTQKSNGSDSHTDLHKNPVTLDDTSENVGDVAHLNIEDALGGPQPRTCGIQTPNQVGKSAKCSQPTARNSEAIQESVVHGPQKQSKNSNGTISSEQKIQEGTRFKDLKLELKPRIVRSSLRSDLIARATRDPFLNILKIEETTSKNNGAPSPLFGKDVPRRTVPELLRLPLCPRLRLPQGGACEYAVRTPLPPPAKATTPLHELLDHTATLFADLTLKMFGEADQRMRGVAKAKSKTKAVVMIERWWRACAEKDVKPAEWLLWSLKKWQERHPDQKPSLSGVCSERMVRDNAVRHFFRDETRPLGGRLEYDSVGMQFVRKHKVLERRITQLCVDTLGLATDEEVAQVVAEFFPKGVENATKLQLEVHQKVTAETARLRDLADRGHFVWPV